MTNQPDPSVTRRNTHPKNNQSKIQLNHMTPVRNRPDRVTQVFVLVFLECFMRKFTLIDESNYVIIVLLSI